MCVLTIGAQKISGVIVDDDGEAIPFASAMYKGHHVAVAAT